MLAVPASVLGQTPSAILHTRGGVWVNGYEGKEATAVFAGDLIETKPSFAAELKLDGTSILIQPESVVKFQGDSLTLDHGSVSIETGKGFKVLVNCITVVPVDVAWTQYDVTDVNRTIHVGARKRDVNVNGGISRQKDSPETPNSQRASVHEGEQRTYDETELCGPGLKPAGAANGIDPKWIAAGAGGAAALILILTLGSGGGNKTPISNSQP
jgi:hypothetical protein